MSKLALVVGQPAVCCCPRQLRQNLDRRAHFNVRYFGQLQRLIRQLLPPEQTFPSFDWTSSRARALVVNTDRPSVNQKPLTLLS
jgi:hypothetical protein